MQLKKVMKITRQDMISMNTTLFQSKNEVHKKKYLKQENDGNSSQYSFSII